MARGGFDVVIGNPPYVEYAKVRTAYQVRGYTTESSGNLFAFVIERSLALMGLGGYVGMIIPMSLVSTEKMQLARSKLGDELETICVSNYSGDAHPAVLFSGVKMRLSVVIGRKLPQTRAGPGLYSTRFQRWYSAARPQLFQQVSYVSTPPSLLLNGLIPKIGGAVDLQVLRRVSAQRVRLGRYVLGDRGNHSIYAHRIVAHFVKCFDFVPYFRNDRDGVKKSEDYKVFSFATRELAALAASILNSSTFYFFYLLYSDAYHCGRELILSFPCDLIAFQSNATSELIRLNVALMADLQRNSVRRNIEYHGTGEIEYDEFYPRRSKALIDEIDRVLAQHYDFTDEELDFIVNYDIKYRMGDELFEDGDGG